MMQCGVSECPWPPAPAAAWILFWYADRGRVFVLFFFIMDKKAESVDNNAALKYYFLMSTPSVGQLRDFSVTLKALPSTYNALTQDD